VLQILLPEGWPQPRGYAHGVAASGRLVFVAGQIGCNSDGVFAPGGGFADQFRQVLRNTLAVLAAAGAQPAHVTRMTWYVVDKGEYLACLRELGAIWRQAFGTHYPAMAVVQVAGLIEDAARLEIETTAVLPAGSGRRRLRSPTP
jgi:enamine deaminase RidA (YjgF/YER057c/UK114 family)